MLSHHWWVNPERLPSFNLFTYFFPPPSYCIADMQWGKWHISNPHPIMYLHNMTPFLLCLPRTDGPVLFFREVEMLLTSQRSQRISFPETHSVQSSHRHFQQPIWVLMSEMKTFMCHTWHILWGHFENKTCKRYSCVTVTSLSCDYLFHC